MDTQKETLHKRIIAFVWIAIIASTMSLFGFVYEEIDFIPNYFTANPIEAKIQWSNFHSVTNPAHYHIPASIGAIFSIIAIWFYKQQLSNQQRRNLKTASVMIILINIVTGIAVTQINDKLYFAAPVDNAEMVRNLAVIWATLNFIRLSCAAICTTALVKMFSMSFGSMRSGSEVV